MFDIWFNKTCATLPNCVSPNTSPDGLELMVVLQHFPGQGFIGSYIGNVTIDAWNYDIYASTGTPNTITYVNTSQQTATWSLFLSNIMQDAVNRGYLSTNWYLVSSEGGFEVWQGGVGLTVNDFRAQLGPLGPPY